MRKVIFLGVDGVINSGNNQQLNDCLNRTPETMYFDPICMKLLKELIDNTDADLILSSHWRFPDKKTKSICHLQNLMKRLADYEMGLVEHTGKTLLSRNDEINEWLHKHPEVGSYVILDDVNDNFEEENLKRLVLTNESIGLSPKDVLKATKALNIPIHTKGVKSMKVHYYWTEDGEAELCDYEKIIIKQEERCEHCDTLIPVGECVKLTTRQGAIFWLHNHCANKGVDFPRR